MAGHVGACRTAAWVVHTPGIRLGVVVSDLHDQSARAMVKAIMAGRPPNEVLELASKRLKASRSFRIRA